jgi:serine/threonine protein kinase/tetratricopeptide (TPR) repeat protein
MTGTTILHYRVGNCLGVGGMGEVYLAEDTRLGRTVALKFLKATQQSDHTHRTRLLKEARAASSLRSSNIAAIYDVVEHDETTFIVMEYVEGEALSARIGKGPLAVRDAVQIGIQAADALDEAHTHGIIHRDIKSANLIVDTRGRVKLLDFGLAKILPGADGAANDMTRSAAMETVAGTVMGTFAYMSPEQVRGRATDVRSDLFSLGVVIYEMLTGRLPFEGGTITEIIDGILHREPEAVARFNYNVPVPLEHAILKLLEKDPDYRYQSARELYVDLSAVARTLEQPESGSRALSVGGTASLARRSAVMAVLEPELDRTIVERAVAVMTFANITREPSDDWIGSGIAETVTSDLKNVRNINVISRTQIFDALKHLSARDLQRVNDQVIDVGRRLGATWIVVGAYQRIGPQIRITAEFVEVRTGQLLKTVKVDGRVDDLFSLQDRIVYELSQGLNVNLRPSEIEAIGRNETDSLEAYENFSRGTMNFRIGSPDALDRAIHLFEQAIAHDQAYASAWAMLGIASNLKGQFLSLPDLTRRAVEALERAVALDPSHATAHAGLGGAYLSSGRHQDALKMMRRATELDPTNALALGSLARALWIGCGEVDEAIATLERTVALNQESGYAFLQLSLLYALRGDLKRAEAAGRHAVELQEKAMSGTEGLQVVGGHVRVGYALYRQERYDEAIAEFEKELAFVSSHDHALRERTTIEISQKLSAAYWRKGDREQADRQFERAVHAFRERVSRGADDPFTKYYIASLHALRGDVATAVRLLEESLAKFPALNRRRATLDPDFDPIRGEREFIALLSPQRSVSTLIE